MLLSGGALLVGDLARPDLLGGEEETRKHARALCRTLKEKILALPDHVMVYPTHVAGSLCGGNIGSLLATTIGYERMNRLLQSVAETEDFEELPLDLGALPTVPPYWARMRKANVEGPAPLGVRTDPPALQVEAFAGHRRDGALFQKYDGDSRFRIRRFLLSKGDCRHIWQRFDSLETCLSQSNDDRKWPKGL